MKRFETKKIKEIALVNRVSLSKSDKWDFLNYLDTGSVTDNEIQNYQFFNLLTDELPSRAKRIAKNGNILFSMVRPNQKHYCLLKNAPENLVVSTGFSVIEANPESVDYRYLYFYFTQGCIVNYLQNIAEQSVCAYPSISSSDIENLIICLPDISTQKRIAAVLGALDDKIENNRKICKNLEEQAQALFKSWFVDYEPWEGIRPDGWKDGHLSDIAEIVMGQSPVGSSLNEQENGMVFYQGRAEFGTRFPTRKLFTTEPKRMANSGDILLSVRAPVGDINIANETCCIGRGLAALKSKFGNQSFLFYVLKELKPYFDIFEWTGTIFGSINKESLNNLDIVIPPKKDMSRFDLSISPLDNLYLKKSFENRHLSAIRDSLIPKLMSGEIDVDKVEL